MDSKNEFRVERKGTEGDCGRHSTKALAEARVRRIVKMSNGRLAAEDFRIVEVKK